MASLHQKYKDEIVPILKERLGKAMLWLYQNSQK